MGARKLRGELADVIRGQVQIGEGFQLANGPWDLSDLIAGAIQFLETGQLGDHLGEAIEPLQVLMLR